MARRFEKGQDISIFVSGEDGFGDSIGRGRRSYHWAWNFDCRNGPAVPAVAELFIGTLTLREPVHAVFEWEDASGNPILVYTTGAGNNSATLRVFQDNAITESSLAQDPYTGGVLFRYDKDATADPDEEMAWFCNGASNDVLVRRKKDGTVSAAGHTVKADSLWVVGSDLWKVGVTDEANSGYKVQKWTVDTDPGLEASWGAAIPVGRPTYPINAIVNLGGSPMVLKGDGVFQYNPAPSVAEFENILPVVPHPDNGKGGFTDGRGRIYYPTVDGHIIVISPGFSSQQTPSKTSYIDRDTPFGRIAAMTADLDHVYAAADSGGGATKFGLGLSVQSVDGGVYTIHTTNVTDDKYTTVADWSLIGTGSSEVDHILIGADEPFMGSYIWLSTPRTAASPVLLLTGYVNAAGGFIPTDLADGTLVFSRDGFIPLRTSTTGNPYDTGDWVKFTLNGISKYWMFIAASLVGSTPLTGVTVREVGVVPYRPPIDPDTFPNSGYVFSNSNARISVGTWRGEEIVWHDVWVSPSSHIEKLLVARSHMTGSTSDRCLYALSRRGLDAYPIGLSVSPLRVPWPKLADYGEATASRDDHMIAFSGVDFGAPATVERAVLEADYLQSDDEVWLYWHWDKADRWEREGPFAKAPITFRPSGKGTVLYTALAFKDGSRSPMAPVFREVSIPGDSWDYSEDYGERGEDAQSPQTI